jgi:hypothetical protein
MQALFNPDVMLETAFNSDNSEQLKALVKSALIELLQERPEESSDLPTELVEELALTKAIEAG